MPQEIKVNGKLKKEKDSNGKLRHKNILTKINNLMNEFSSRRIDTAEVGIRGKQESSTERQKNGKHRKRDITEYREKVIKPT